MVPGGKDVAGVAVLLEKVKARYHAEHEDADGSLRQLAVTRKDSHKGQLANDQRPSSTFRLNSALATQCDRFFNGGRM